MPTFDGSESSWPITGSGHAVMLAVAYLEMGRAAVTEACADGTDGTVEISDGCAAPAAAHRRPDGGAGQPDRGARCRHEVPRHGGQRRGRAAALP
jgi:hypothetical protein